MVFIGDRLKRTVASLLLLINISLLFFQASSAETALFYDEENSVSATFSASDFARLYKLSLVDFYRGQISKAYKTLLRNTRRENFRGYCAMYVNNLLVYYGVNDTYIKGNANTLFSLYSKKSYTDTGYFIESVSAKEYTLKEALTLYATDSPTEIILVVFSKGATEKGKEFGHVFYVNAIIGDTVVFSESAPFAIDNEIIPEGSPIVCSIDQICEKYKYYKFEGILHFVSLSEPPFFLSHWRDIKCRHMLSRSFAQRNHG